MTAQRTKTRYQIFLILLLINFLNNPTFWFRLLELLVSTESPFTLEIITIPLFDKFKLINISTDDGTKDPLEHFEYFNDCMDFYAYSDVIKCQTFQLTLTDKTRVRYQTLKPSTISSFIKFGKHFLAQLFAKRRRPKKLAHMITLQHDKDESLKYLYNRFNIGKIQVVDYPHSVTIIALHKSLH